MPLFAQFTGIPKSNRLAIRTAPSPYTEHIVNTIAAALSSLVHIELAIFLGNRVKPGTFIEPNVNASVFKLIN